MIAAFELSPQLFTLDEGAEVNRIAKWMVDSVADKLHRRGVVIAISGGVDSAVCAAIATLAFGPSKVYGLLLPEKDSRTESEQRGRLVAEHLGIPYELFDIAPTLEALGCYCQRDEAIRTLFPDYGEGWKSKIAISDRMSGGISYFRLIVENPVGEQQLKRLPLSAYLHIVAATNHKQRVRKAIEYYHADRLNFAVIGTPNRLEYDQGFFVKNGDGAADLKPIAHLYKSQVYALARYLKLPESVSTAEPTTDTYSLAQGQDEFYFSLRWDRMDLALWAYQHNVSTALLGKSLGLSDQQAQYVYADIESKRRMARYLHSPALTISEP